MTSTQKPADSTKTTAPFLVGVTGYMDLAPDEVRPLEQRLRCLFKFLRNGAEPDLLSKLVDDLAPDPLNSRRRKRYRRALSPWRGLGRDTPIVVLTNLAPGVDSLAATLVLEEFKAENVSLRCPLPFPPNLYYGASTFVRPGRTDAENAASQRGFLELLHKMGALPPELVCLADGKADPPPELEKALQKVSSEKAFAVQFRDEAGQDEQTLHKQWLADRGDSERRNLRYYAAGEYLTVMADLLVAVWNGRRETSASGASAVVQARLAGPQLQLLPTTTGVPLQSGGIVWHLLAQRPDDPSPTRPRDCAHTRDFDWPLPPLRILHPYRVAGPDCPSAEIIGACQPRNLDLQTERLQTCARAGESLRDFNTKVVPHEADRQQQFEKMLAGPPDAAAEFRETLEKDAPDFAAGLRCLGDVRTRSSDLAAHFQRQVRRTLTWLFWLTFAAALLLQCFSNWRPRPPGPEAFSTEQIVFGWLALTLASCAGAYLAWQRSKKLEPRGHDARAISEGLRVQFYWNLAGLGASVSANYLSRHRSELDWIRSVIRATSFPYERWREWFSKLEPSTQLQALRVVQTTWVRHQLKYHQSASHREHHKLHVWHTLGGVAALAGVLVFLQLVGGASWPRVASAVEVICGVWIAVPLVILTSCFSLLLAWRTAVRLGASGRHGSPRMCPELRKAIADARKAAGKCRNDGESQRRRSKPLRALASVLVWIRWSGAILLEIVNVLVPTFRVSALTRTTFHGRLWHGACSVLAHIPLALIAACATLHICILLAGINVLPSVEDLGVIAGGALLLGGALSVAWAEKNLHSEFAYQYDTMAGLFEAADYRLDDELKKFAGAIDAGKASEQQKSLRRIQSLLFDLGQEALDENAEWVILHRARPLEPVMAG